MNVQEHTDCVHTLLDILCYEISSQRLSPEMEQLLSEHLKDCPCCQKSIHNFREVLQESEVC